MVELPYDIDAALAYAGEWALFRNPKYMDFSNMGGDCTNFASQCLYAGAGAMNYQKSLGWYYLSPGKRSPSWSGVHFFHEFLVNNKGLGPYAEEVSDMPALGDFIQLKSDGHFHHTVLVSSVDDSGPYVTTHSYDAKDRPLSSYVFDDMRILRVRGVRKA